MRDIDRLRIQTARYREAVNVPAMGSTSANRILIALVTKLESEADLAEKGYYGQKPQAPPQFGCLSRAGGSSVVIQLQLQAAILRS
jgi:hypothetical protein